MITAEVKSSIRRSAAYQKAEHIVQDLRAAGFTAYFVGGCVRDILLATDPVDFDIATDARPDDVMRVFPQAKGIGKRFGVSVIETPEGSFEIAAFRQDGFYYDHRRPAWVDYAGIAEDALRRDFTVNALYFDPTNEEIIDLVDGRSDLQKRILRMIGDPFERFDEDWLRLLRAIRFATRFRLKFDPRTWDALRTLSPMITGIADERCTDEVRKMLQGPYPGRAIGLLHKCGLWQALWPNLDFDKTRIRKVIEQLRTNRSKAVVWAIFLLDVPDSFLSEIIQNIKLTRTEKKYLKVR